MSVLTKTFIKTRQVKFPEACKTLETQISANLFQPALATV